MILRLTTMTTDQWPPAVRLWKTTMLIMALLVVSIACSPKQDEHLENKVEVEDAPSEALSPLAASDGVDVGGEPSQESIVMPPALIDPCTLLTPDQRLAQLGNGVQVLQKMTVNSDRKRRSEFTQVVCEWGKANKNLMDASFRAKVHVFDTFAAPQGAKEIALADQAYSATREGLETLWLVKDRIVLELQSEESVDHGVAEAMMKNIASAPMFETNRLQIDALGGPKKDPCAVLSETTVKNTIESNGTILRLNREVFEDGATLNCSWINDQEDIKYLNLAFSKDSGNRQALSEHDMWGPIIDGERVVFKRVKDFYPRSMRAYINGIALDISYNSLITGKHLLGQDHYLALLDEILENLGFKNSQ